METQEQISLLKHLRGIQSFILNSTDKEAIKNKIDEAINLSLPVQPHICHRKKDASYKLQKKSRALQMLVGDIATVDRSGYPDWKTLHFQVNSSITILMTVYFDGSIARGLDLIEG